MNVRSFCSGARCTKGGLAASHLWCIQDSENVEQPPAAWDKQNFFLGFCRVLSEHELRCV
eukprot:2914180-Rhodomonas_salina.1